MRPYRTNSETLRDFNTITEEDFFYEFATGSSDRLAPLPWGTLVSRVGITLEEAEILANRTIRWKRVITFYKEACKSTLTVGIRDDSKAAMEFYKSEYMPSNDDNEIEHV